MRPKNRFIIFFIDVYEKLIIFARYVGTKALYIQQQDAHVRGQETLGKIACLQKPGSIYGQSRHGCAVFLDICCGSRTGASKDYPPQKADSSMGGEGKGAEQTA